MDEKIKFLAYCVEAYKSAKKMTGKETFNLFYKKGALDFILNSYPALHTTGAEYTIASIDDFLKLAR